MSSQTSQPELRTCLLGIPGATIHTTALQRVLKIRKKTATKLAPLAHEVNFIKVEGIADNHFIQTANGTTLHVGQVIRKGGVLLFLKHPGSLEVSGYTRVLVNRSSSDVRILVRSRMFGTRQNNLTLLNL